MNAIKFSGATCTPVPSLVVPAKPLTCTLARSAMGRPVVDPMRLRRECALEFVVDEARIAARDRHRAIVYARHVFWWIARSSWGHSFPDLGRLLDRSRPFDHTTVMHGVSRIEREVDRESRFAVGLFDTGSRLGRAALAIKARMEAPTRATET